MFPELHRYPVFAYDTETTGLRWEDDSRVFGFSISTPDNKDYYFDIRETPRAWEWLAAEAKRLDPAKNRIVCHNAAFDYHISRETGVKLPIDCLDDTVVRACLIDEHHFSYELDNLGKIYLGREKVDIVPKLAEIFGGRRTRNVQMRNLPNAPVELVAEYAVGDSRLTLDLWDWQTKEIAKQDQMEGPSLSGMCAFERKLMPTILRNEERGIRVDIHAAEKAAYGLTQQIEPLQDELNQIGLREINVNSSDDMHRLFQPKYNQSEERWFALDGTPLPSTPGGKASLAAEALLAMANKPSKLVIEIRKLLKLRDTFINGHVLGHQINGRIHPRIHQTKGPDGGTGTGRFSYSAPALQQIPSRDKGVSKVIRPIFLPDEGESWVDSDMASFEVRAFAHLVNNPTVVAEYHADPHLDLHAYVAELSKLPRNKPPEGGANAKQLNLSMIFNSGNGAIAEQMDLPWAWDSFLPRDREDKPENYIVYKKAGPIAMAAINNYHRRMPGVREFADSAKERAIERGYVFTKHGRRLRFPHGFRAYKASGLIIQATSADWNKENWMIIEEQLEGEGRLLINTHDSYGLSLPEGQEKKLAKRVKDGIEQRERSRVPLVLEVNRPGANWWDSYSSECWFS